MSEGSKRRLTFAGGLSGAAPLSIAACLLLAGSASAQDWKPARVWVAGSERTTWVVAGSGGVDGKKPVLQFWYVGGSKETTASPTQNAFNPAVNGAPVCLAADAEALRILYPDLSVYDHYGERRASLGALWKEQAEEPPVAWAGNATSAEFWAVAATASLSVPTTGEVPLEDGPPATAPAAVEPAPRWTLLYLTAGVWRRMPLPAAAEAGERFWLAPHANALHLFWLDDAGVLQTADRRDGEWTAAERVGAVAGFVTGWAGAAGSGPVFVMGEAASADRVTLRLLRHRDGAWRDEGLARDGTEVLVLDPMTAGVAIARGRLAVARLSAAGQVEFGLADLAMSPSVRFTPLRLGLTTAPATRSDWAEAVVMGLLMGLVTMLLWSRRDRMVATAALPQGVALAPISRRVFATLLDILPAFLLVTVIALPFMYSRLGGLPPTLDLVALQERAADPQLQPLLAPVHYGVILLYGVWCLIWELSIGTTPGKLLFKCRVLSSTGEPPRPRQILIRNAIRVVEFALGSPGLLITFMTMMLVTRNRQRIGDLLADTVVVEPAAATPPPPAE